MVETLVAFAALLTMAFARIPIAFAMLIVGVVGFALKRGFAPALEQLAQTTFAAGINYFGIADLEALADPKRRAAVFDGWVADQRDAGLGEFDLEMLGALMAARRKAMGSSSGSGSSAATWAFSGPAS